jgi:hypothetical protein
MGGISVASQTNVPALANKAMASVNDVASALNVN